MLSTFRKGERGFTLPELLVVLLIVAILTALGIALFVSQRSKAQDAEAKKSAATVVKALEIYHQERGTYAGADQPTLARYDPTITTVRGLVVASGADDFEVTVESAADAGGGPYIIERDAAGATERRCTVPGQGGCPDSGRW